MYNFYTIMWKYYTLKYYYVKLILREYLEKIFAYILQDIFNEPNF